MIPAYEDEIKTGFVRSCIKNDIIVNYQKDRMKKIRKTLMEHKSNTALNELDNELENSSYK